MSQPQFKDRLRSRRKILRHRRTKAEVIFRQRLLDGDFSFEFQPLIPPYIPDFVFPERMLIVELDGGYHYETEQIEYDARRTRYLERLGFTVIRVDNSDAAHVSLDWLRSIPLAAKYAYREAKATALSRVGIKTTTKAKCSNCGERQPVTDGHVLPHKGHGRLAQCAGGKAI